MPKRFTDTDKWKKPFIRLLPAPYKLLWFYILDDCDHAGIWQGDFEVASIRIGHDVNEEEMLKYFGHRVTKFSEGKFFLPEFIFFQYGNLTEKNRLHLSVIQILNKYGLKPLRSPLEGAKDKEQYKDKDKEMDNVLNWESEKRNFFNDFRWKEKFCLDKKLEMSGLEKMMTEFINDIELKEDYKILKELKSHFTNTFNKKKNGSAINQPGGEKLGTSGKRIETARNW